jgi:hypothetical protein
MLIKRVVTVLIFLLLVNAGVRMGLVILHDQNFKDSVKEVALFAGQGNKSDDLLKKMVMDKATENQIPLYPEFVEITHIGTPNGDKVTIKVAYAVIVPLAPGYSRRFDFSYQTP